MRYSSIVGIVELVFIDSLAISFVGGDSIVRSSVLYRLGFCDYV